MSWMPLSQSIKWVVRAFDISIQTRDNFYDCLYVALAEQEGCELRTANAKLILNRRPSCPFITSLATLS